MFDFVFCFCFSFLAAMSQLSSPSSSSESLPLPVRFEVNHFIPVDGITPSLLDIMVMELYKRVPADEDCEVFNLVFEYDFDINCCTVALLYYPHTDPVREEMKKKFLFC